MREIGTRKAVRARGRSFGSIAPGVLVVALAASTAAVMPAIAAPSEGPAGGGDLRMRLAEAELLAGLTPVSGPGLVVTLKHSPRMAPSGTDPQSLRVNERDVTAVLNSLKGAGAEALALSGAGGTFPERLTGTSAIVDAGDGIRVNGNVLNAPFRILVIGDAAALRKELFRQQGVVKTAALDTLEMIELQDAPELMLPPARKPMGFRFARPAGPATADAMHATPAPEVAAPVEAAREPANIEAATLEPIWPVLREFQALFVKRAPETGVRLASTTPVRRHEASPAAHRSSGSR